MLFKKVREWIVANKQVSPLEDSAYAQALEELQTGNYERGAWARALAANKGEPYAISEYLKIRVPQILLETARAEHEAKQAIAAERERSARAAAQAVAAERERVEALAKEEERRIRQKALIVAVAIVVGAVLIFT